MSRHRPGGSAGPCKAPVSHGEAYGVPATRSWGRLDRQWGDGGADGGQLERRRLAHDHRHPARAARGPRRRAAAGLGGDTRLVEPAAGRRRVRRVRARAPTRGPFDREGPGRGVRQYGARPRSGIDRPRRGAITGAVAASHPRRRCRSLPCPGRRNQCGLAAGFDVGRAAKQTEAQVLHKHLASRSGPEGLVRMERNGPRFERWGPNETVWWDEDPPELSTSDADHGRARHLSRPASRSDTAGPTCATGRAACGLRPGTAGAAIDRTPLRRDPCEPALEDR